MVGAMLDVLRRSGQNIDAAMIEKSCEVLSQQRLSASRVVTPNLSAGPTRGYARQRARHKLTDDRLQSPG